MIVLRITTKRAIHKNTNNQEIRLWLLSSPISVKESHQQGLQTIMAKPHIFLVDSPIPRLAVIVYIPRITLPNIMSGHAGCGASHHGTVPNCTMPATSTAALNHQGSLIASPGVVANKRAITVSQPLCQIAAAAIAQTPTIPVA